MAPETPQILQGLENAGVDIPASGPQPTGFNGPQGSTYDSGVGRLPAPQVPMRPAGQQDETTAPDIHPVDNMAMAFMGHLLDNQKNGVPTPPPGSFAAKLGGALSAAGEGLGDMRTGGDPGQGHGWLSAVGATLNARTQRLEHQKEVSFDQQERLKNDQINLAVANSNLRQHAMAIQQQEKTVRDASAASGSKFMDTLRANYKVSDNLSQDELMSKAQSDPTFLQTHTARITGYEPMLDASGQERKDANGLPIEMPKYSIADIAPGDMSKQYTVDAAHAKKWADSGLQQVPADTVMPVSVANQMDVQAERYGTTLSILNLAKVQPLPDAVKNQMVSALQDPEVQHAVAMQPGSPLAGLFDAQKTVADHLTVAQQQLADAQKSGNPQAIAAAQKQLQDVQNTQKNLDQTIGSGFTKEERTAYVKEKTAEAKQDALDEHNAARDAETKRHNLVMEGKTPDVGGALGNVPMSEGLQKQIADLRTANPSAAAVLEHYDTGTQGSLMAVAFGDGSVDFEKTFPSRLTKGAPGINAQAAINVLTQINPNFSVQQYRATQNAYKEATSSKNAQAIQQYNNFIQHSSEAVDALAATSRKGPRVWNTVLNKLENAGYGTDATKIQAALSGPRGEISLLLSGGYKPMEEEQKAINTIMSDAATPAQLSAALQQYAQMGTVRLDNINENYKRVTGKNLPRIINQKTLDAAKHLGIDAQSARTLQNLDSSGTIFGSQTPTGANAPPQTFGHKVGGQITQNGHTYTITSVDANGKVTGAQ